MKVALPLLAAIICVIVIIVGKLQWNEKTKVTVTNEAVAAETSSKSDSNDTKAYVSQSLFSYTKNWPQAAQESFKKTLEAGKIYKIAIVGSQSLGDDTKGWASQLKNALINTYGEDHVDVSIFKYDNVTSSKFITNNEDEVINFGANFILFEPFLLNDNHFGLVTDNHQNILTFINDVQKKKKDTVVILQPSNPIANGIYYPDQVKQLQEFAKAEDIPYVDHWPAWTNPVSQYLDNNSNPNAKGFQVWYEFLRNYFIAM